MKKYLVGIDVGGTKCAVIFAQSKSNQDATDDFTFLDRKYFATNTYDGPEQVIGHLIAMVQEMLDRFEVKTEDVMSIGISCGGPLDHKRGIIKNPPNLCGWNDVPIVRYFEDHFGIPTFLQNDANACALAEWQYGAGKGYENVIFLTFGTGLGAGLILNGKLYNGANDMAGEVGHIRLENSGPVGYGKAGSFEGFCSGGGIAQLAKLMVLEKLQMGIKPAFCPDMQSLDTLTAKSVACAAKNGDKLAKEIYATCGHYLGRGLSILIDILNPEIIVIGSVYERSGDLMNEALEAAIREEALTISRNACRIVPAKLGNRIGDYAAMSVALHGGID